MVERTVLETIVELLHQNLQEGIQPNMRVRIDFEILDQPKKIFAAFQQNRADRYRFIGSA